MFGVAHGVGKFVCHCCLQSYSIRWIQARVNARGANASTTRQTRTRETGKVAKACSLYCKRSGDIRSPRVYRHRVRPPLSFPRSCGIKYHLIRRFSARKDKDKIFINKKERSRVLETGGVVTAKGERSRFCGFRIRVDCCRSGPFISIPIVCAGIIRAEIILSIHNILRCAFMGHASLGECHCSSYL